MTGRSDPTPSEIRCPRCGRKLEGRRERFGDIYVCKPCAIIILDLKPIMDKWEVRRSKSL